MKLGLGLGLTKQQGGSAPPPVDPDAAIAAVLAGGVNFALDTARVANMWVEDTKVTQVSAANDQVGALSSRFGTPSYNFLNSIAANRPLWDGTGALICDGTTDLLASTDAFGFLNAATHSFLCVYVYVSALSTTHGVIGISTPTTNASRCSLSILIDGSVQFNIRRADADANTAITSVAGTCVVGGFYLITADHNCSTGAMRLWVDGNLAASGTAASTGATYSATNSGRFRLGQSVAASGGYFAGNIRRPVMATKAISDADRAIIEDWVSTAGLVSGAYFIASGARSWFSDDTVTLDGTTAYVGVAREGSLPSLVRSVSLPSMKVRTAHITTTALAGGDDHNEPAILKLDNGTYMVGSVAHNVDTFQMALGSTMTSLVESDIAADLATVNMSYCNLYQLEGETNDPIYLFGRGGSPWSARYSSSTDGGVNWGAYTIWCENGTNRPYVKFCKSSPTRIDFILTEGHPDTLNTSIYHGYFEGGAFYKTDGTSAGALPINPSSFTLVFDGSATNGSWTWDLKRVSGELVAVFASFPSLTAHRYHRAVLSGTSWTVETVVSDAGTNLYTGSPNYSGGIAISPTNKDLMYCSVGPVGAHQIYPYTRSGGGTWTQGSAITSGSPRSFRPKTVPGLLTFVRGTYTSYTSFDDCKIMGVLI